MESTTPSVLNAGGNLFMFDSCPFVVSGAAGAAARRAAKAMKGNLIELTSHGGGELTQHRIVGYVAYRLHAE